MIESFKNLLGNGKNYLTQKTTPDKEAVFYAFKEITQEYFGEVGLKKLTPDCFFKETLFIKSQNPLWSSELWENKEGIVCEINKKLGETFVREIKMK